jgi:hypothetical protein
MSDACELRLRVEGALLGRLVEAVVGERQQLGEGLVVLHALVPHATAVHRPRRAGLKGVKYLVVGEPDERPALGSAPGSK